jgi:antitoxin (DNA-binding transcriptional repressor) of toxin-antitoxin stability system
VKQVNISEAKAQLSKHIAYVRRGGQVRIFDRDLPVADLVPIQSSKGGTDDDALLADMERRGVVRRGKAGPLPPEILQPGPSGASVLDALLEERRGGR